MAVGIVDVFKIIDIQHEEAQLGFNVGGDKGAVIPLGLGCRFLWCALSVDLKGGYVQLFMEGCHVFFQGGGGLCPIGHGGNHLAQVLNANVAGTVNPIHVGLLIDVGDEVSLVV